MSEGVIQLPVDGAGKSTRTRTGDTGMPASTHTPVSILSDTYGYVLGEGTGSLGALDAVVTVDVPLIASAWVADVRGTFVGTVSFEFTANGTDWGGAVARLTGVGGNTDLVTSTTATGLFRGNVSGMRQFRLRMSAYTSGSATVVVRLGMGTGPIFLNASLPTGTDTIGGVTHGVATAAAVTRVTAAASDTQIVAANTSRRGLIVVNDGNAIMYLKYGTGATTTSFTAKLTGGAYWEMPNPVYAGQVNAIWSAANGAAQVTELTV